MSPLFPLTSHEDGAVRFWDASTTSLQLLYKLTTAPLFGSDVGAADNAAGEEEEWPPFRKVSHSVQLCWDVICHFI